MDNDQWNIQTTDNIKINVVYKDEKRHKIQRTLCRFCSRVFYFVQSAKNLSDKKEKLCVFISLF